MEQTASCRGRVDTIVEQFDRMAKIVKGEDEEEKELNAEMLHLKNIYSDLGTKLVTNFRDVAYTIDNYVNQSISTNSEAVSNVKSTNSVLNEIDAELNNIPTTYHDFN